MPETLYVRGQPPVESPGKYYRMRVTGTKAVDRKLQLIDFARAFQIDGIFIYFWQAEVLADRGTRLVRSVMPAQTVSALFRTYYKWGLARTGVALSVSTTIGGVLGEIVSGPVIDKLMDRSRKRTGRPSPRDAYSQSHNIIQSRLHGMWPTIFFLPAGLLMFGFSIANHDLEHSYIGATVGMAVTCFAVQMITTPIIAYCVDCYKPQSAEMIQLLNFARSEIPFTVGFWSIRYARRKQYHLDSIEMECSGHQALPSETKERAEESRMFVQVVWDLFTVPEQKKRVLGIPINHGLRELSTYIRVN
ncbi:hypothetical protein B0H19DRAFT_1235573 [Mycena capillaripes]|nr:hypothetical protein B0H19DRAFT_1235573 [Mycena capillaripes]